MASIQHTFNRHYRKFIKKGATLYFFVSFDDKDEQPADKGCGTKAKAFGSAAQGGLYAPSCMVQQVSHQTSRARDARGGRIRS